MTKLQQNKQKTTKNSKKTLKTSKKVIKNVTVQLALLSKTIPTGNDFLFETKFDGYRIIAKLDKKNVKLISRNGKDFTSKFVDIATSLQKYKAFSPFVLDGEVVVFDKTGRSDFGDLQQSIKSGAQKCVYEIFDILQFKGVDIRSLPLLKRKEKLNEIFSTLQQNLELSSFVVGKGKECFKFAKKNNLEGVVAKKVDSTYQGNRNGDWLKIKCYARQEFVVVGYTKTEKRFDLSAILMAYYKQNKLVFAGKVGTGFSDKTRSELKNKFDSQKTTKCPLAVFPKQQNAIWLTPKFVAEIQFAEMTKDGLIRQGSFVGLREDKLAKDVVLESDYE